ncbi:hypothetical protein D3C71_994820 [compost metagenome]
MVLFNILTLYNHRDSPCSLQRQADSAPQAGIFYRRTPPARLMHRQTYTVKRPDAVRRRHALTGIYKDKMKRQAYKSLYMQKDRRETFPAALSGCRLLDPADGRQERHFTVGRRYDIGVKGQTSPVVAICMNDACHCDRQTADHVTQTCVIHLSPPPFKQSYCHCKIVRFIKQLPTSPPIAGISMTAKESYTK